MSNQPDIIEIFFNHDPSVISSRSSEGKTALELAATSGNKEAVKYLLSKGELNGFMLFTPLLAAVSNGHKDVAGYCIDRGANMDLLNPKNKNIFYIARQTDKPNGGMGMEEFLNRKVAEKFYNINRAYYSG